MSDSRLPAFSDVPGVPDTRDGATPYGVVGTDFLTFAIGGGANVEDQTSYYYDAQRQTGNLPGIARSNFNNKAIRQGTFVAHSLCLWISQQLQIYIPDDGNDIAWIGEWSQALAYFILATIPPPPNLGLYLPLAGGTMNGHIWFEPGIATILSNNTWYYAKDTGGTPRGIIIKSNDNNIYINDGTAGYVIINGTPVINNNYTWSGRITNGAVYPVIGLLSDNAVHVGSGSSGHIYLDCVGSGSVWVTSNVVIPNNCFYYARDTGGSARGILGLNAGNSLLIGSGGIASTDIYAGGGQPIYLHSNTNALGQFQSNGYYYCQGGGRAYIPGGNDPWQIYADNGYYARIHYIVGGVRDWTAGCLSGGYYAIADESAQAVRLQIDFNGTVTCLNSIQVNGGATVNGGVTLGGLTVSGFTSLNGGCNIYNALYVQSGAFNVNGASGFGGGVTMYNGLNVAGGSTSMGTLTCGNFTAGGSGQVNGGLTVYNSINIASGGITVAGGINVVGNGAIGTGLTVGGNFHGYGAGQIDGGMTIYNGLNVATGNNEMAGTLNVHNGLNVWNSAVIQNGRFTVNADCIIGSDTTVGGNLQVNGGAQINNGLTLYGNLNMPNGGASMAGGLTCAGFQDNGNGVITGSLQVNNSATIYGGISISSGGLYVAGGITSNGNCSFNSYTHVGQLQVGGLGYAYDNGGGTLTFQNSISTSGNWVFTGGVSASGNVNATNLWAGSNCYALGFTSGVYGYESDGNVWLKQGGRSVQWQQGDGSRHYLAYAIGDWWIVASCFAGSQPPQPDANWFAVMFGGIQILTGGNAWKAGGGLWADSSERRFKREIEDYEVGLDVVRKLRPRSYKFNGRGGTTDDDRRHVGLIIDEVEDFMPELVGEMETREKLDAVRFAAEVIKVKTLDATAVIYALVNSVKTLADRLDVLEGRA